MLYSQNLQELMGFTASKLYQELQADNILIIQGEDSVNFEQKELENLKVQVLSRGKETEDLIYVHNEQNLFFPDKIKSILIEAIKAKLIGQEAKVVMVFDKSVTRDYTLGMVVVEVSRVLYRIGRFDLGEHMDNDVVISKVIDLADQIRTEGREGKKIGTMFLVGDKEELRPFLKPLVLNPFHGYPENMRDLKTNELNDTMKEYAQLDGAFVITNQGIVESAGTYVDISTEGVKKFSGWGTRHLTAAAITEKTNSVAVLVSESGGLVKVFKKGKLILKF
jgi:DNA integrity scanning protein DisA with diadenylate cyclase activity